MNVLQKSIGYQFNNEKLLKQALTHRSYSSVHNERLEFLGDSVLNLSVAAKLFEYLPQASEGDLSRVRAHLVREATLHKLALKLGLNSYLLLGEGELRSGGKERPSILADALEALIGAMYLDAGFEKTQIFVSHLFDDEFKNHSQSSQSWGKDAKTALQEWLQRSHLSLPQYTVSATQGALHNQTFTVECAVVQLDVLEQGQGTSRRLAEQAAAEKVLALLQQKYGDNPKHIKIVNKTIKS